MKRVAFATLTSLALLIGTIAALLGDLPDPIATHFGADGVADGFAPRAAALPLGIGIPALVAALLTAMTWTTRRPPSGMRWTLGLPVGIVWGVGGVLLATFAAQVGLDDAAEAVVDPVAIVGALAVGVAATLMASRLARLDDPPESTAGAPVDSPRASLPVGATALWRGESPTGRAPIAMAVLVALGGIVLGLFIAWWLTLLLVGVATLLVASTRFATTIGPAEVRIAGMPAGWPRVVVPLDTVTRATVTRVRPFEFGGWGVRMQPGLDTTAVVTGGGPALELRRTDGSRIVVSLRDPEAAAAVVSSLLDRRAGRARSGPPTSRPR